MSRSSERALDAAASHYYFGVYPGDESEASPAEIREMAERVLGAAHDPALGVDRSVCLGELVERLRELYPSPEMKWYGVADFIESEFATRLQTR